MRASLLILALCVQDVRTEPDPGALWNEGRRLEAIEAGAAELARRPGDDDLRARLVGWEMAVHRYAAALEHMEPLGVRCESLRGEALYRLSEYARAVEHLSDSDPGQILMRIDAFEALGRFAESDEALEKSRALFGKEDPRLLACDGRRLARLKRWPEAILAFRAAVEKDPLDSESLFGLGRALVQGGQREEGLEALARHREITPLLDQQDFARRGIDLAPRHAPNWTALGDAERSLGRLDRAEEAYRAAASFATPAELVPNALRHSRMLAEDRKNVAAAIDMLAQAVERAPDARLWVRIGDLKRDDGRKEESIRAYSKALELRPGDAEVQKRLAGVRDPPGERK